MATYNMLKLKQFGHHISQIFIPNNNCLSNISLKCAEREVQLFVVFLGTFEGSLSSISFLIV